MSLRKSVRITRDLDKVVDKYAKIWYSILNREIFNSKLPKKLLVASARVKDCRGGTIVKGRTVEGVFIDPRDPELVSVLLHEMCHVYQTVVSGYDDKSPEHDHAFWQLLAVSTKKMNKLFNKIYSLD